MQAMQKWEQHGLITQVQSLPATVVPRKDKYTARAKEFAEPLPATDSIVKRFEKLRQVTLDERMKRRVSLPAIRRTANEVWAHACACEGEWTS